MLISAAERQCRLVLQKPAKDRDGFTDQPTDPPIDVATVYGKPIPQRMAERYASPEYLATLDYLFNVAFNPEILPGRWFLYDGRRLDIEKVYDPTQRRREMVVGCTEVVK